MCDVTKTPFVAFATFSAHFLFVLISISYSQINLRARNVSINTFFFGSYVFLGSLTCPFFVTCLLNCHFRPFTFVASCGKAQSTKLWAGKRTTNLYFTNNYCVISVSKHADLMSNNVTHQPFLCCLYYQRNLHLIVFLLYSTCVLRDTLFFF